MSNEHGKPIYLTQGERRLVIKACEAAIETWAVAQINAEAEALYVAKLRCSQYKRIIRECQQADPEPKLQ